MPAIVVIILTAGDGDGNGVGATDGVSDGIFGSGVDPFTISNRIIRSMVRQIIKLICSTHESLPW